MNRLFIAITIEIAVALYHDSLPYFKYLFNYAE